jgi:hypothetical protein
MGQKFGRSQPLERWSSVRAGRTGQQRAPPETLDGQPVYHLKV